MYILSSLHASHLALPLNQFIPTVQSRMPRPQHHNESYTVVFSFWAKPKNCYGLPFSMLTVKDRSGPGEILFWKVKRPSQYLTNAAPASVVRLPLKASGSRSKETHLQKATVWQDFSKVHSIAFLYIMCSYINTFAYWGWNVEMWKEKVKKSEMLCKEFQEDLNVSKGRQSSSMGTQVFYITEIWWMWIINIIHWIVSVKRKLWNSQLFIQVTFQLIKWTIFCLAGKRHGLLFIKLILNKQLL